MHTHVHTGNCSIPGTYTQATRSVGTGLKYRRSDATCCSSPRSPVHPNRTFAGLRSGDRACVRFRFIQRPEYVTSGTRFVFREGRTKGIGIVVGTEHQPADRINTPRGANGEPLDPHR